VEILLTKDQKRDFQYTIPTARSFKSESLYRPSTMSGTSLLPVGLGPLLLITAVLCFVAPAHAFGAGNIPDTSALDGHLWRHGDIADLLITLPMSFITNRAFKKVDVKVIYFGNWLRDYSQLLDVGSITKIPEDILRSLVSISGADSM